MLLVLLLLELFKLEVLQTFRPLSVYTKVTRKQAKHKYKKTVYQTMLSVYKNSMMGFYLLLPSRELKNRLTRSYE